MKQKVGVCFAAVFCMSYAKNQEFFGRSAFIARPADARLMTRNHGFKQIEYEENIKNGGAIQVTVLGHKTISKAHNARAFLCNGKDVLTIAGDQSQYAFNRDIRAEWFGLPDNYFSLFSIKPSIKQSGIIFETTQSFGSLLPFEFFKEWKWGVRLPFLMVEHSLAMKESNILNNNSKESMPFIARLDQSSWLYHRWRQKNSQIGVGDMELYLDGAHLYEEFSIISYRSGVIIPTATKQDSTYFFDAVLGNNKRIGLKGAVDFQILLNNNVTNLAAVFFASLESAYYLRTHRHRTFDLKLKPFSRFLNFNAQFDLARQNVAGVNLLSRLAHIRPQTMVDFCFGWRFITHTWNAEFGYSVWGKDSERIKEVEGDFDTKYGIAAESLAGVIRTASASTIANAAAPDATFIAITNNDLDLQSASSASQLQHTVHLAFDYYHKGRSINSFLGLGGYAEFAQKNSGFNGWGIWFKIGAGF